MPKPMSAFMSDALSLHDVFTQLREDFAQDGHPGVAPDTTFYDAPPVGMGYANRYAMQAFINNYVNSTPGRKRYNLADTTTIFVDDVVDPKCVGNLAALIYAKQK